MVQVGVDTYNDVAEADTYYSVNYGYPDWAALDTAVKEQLLVSSTSHLDMMCTWYGVKCVADQALAFPRTDDCPDIAPAIKTAQLEVAYSMHTAGTATVTAGDPLTELTAGSVTLKFKASSASNPFKTDYVTELISPYGMCGGSGQIPLVRV